MNDISGTDKIRQFSLSNTESETPRDGPSRLPTTATKHPFSFPSVSFQYEEGRGLGQELRLVENGARMPVFGGVIFCSSVLLETVWSRRWHFLELLTEDRRPGLQA